MHNKTYDRNVIKGLALVADEHYSKVRYVSIIAASTLVEDVSLSMLKRLHQAAHGVISETNPSPDLSLWSRYSALVSADQQANTPH